MGLMDDHGQEIILMSALMGSFGIALVCMTFIPEPYGRIIGGIAYFMVLFAIFLGGKYSTQLKYSPYPNYEIATRPEDDSFNVFADTDSVLQMDDDGETGTMILHSHFKMQVPGFEGKKERVSLHYNGKIGDRVSLRPRSITIAGFLFEHPQSDLLIVKSVGSYLDHGVEIPAFKLLNGALDLEPTFNDVSLSSSYSKNGKAKVEEKSEDEADLLCGKCSSPLPFANGFSTVQCQSCHTNNKVN